jgi:hypothetical protein
LAHINLEPCVGHLITKTILEIAQEHISLSINHIDIYFMGGNGENSLEKKTLARADEKSAD